jgi:hypothetical protein
VDLDVVDRLGAGLRLNGQHGHGPTFVRGKGTFLIVFENNQECPLCLPLYPYPL